MKLSLKSINIREDLDRLKAIHWGHFYIVFCALLAELYHGVLSPIGALFEVVLLAFLYRFYFKTVKELYYTFWTFSLFLALYLLKGMFNGIFVYDTSLFFFLYLLAFVLFLTEVYILSSPIYFPMVSWWEYDFRYRDELKVVAKFFVAKNGEKKVEGRLTDLRREAGCLVLLEEVEVGDIVTIHYSNVAIEHEFTAKIMSHREPLVGRGHTYGVKFYFKDSDAHEEFNNFVYLWKVDKKMRKQKRYSHEVATEA
jgi:hypothetical protein